MSNGLHLELPESVLDRLVEQVAERVRSELADSSPWMTRPAAAVYLDVPVSRLEKDKTVPCHRWDGRVLYHRPELDEWLRSQ